MDNTIAVIGKFGTGKSLKMVELAAKLANTYKLRIVSNFPIDRKALLAYAEKKKYRYLKLVPIKTINLVLEGMTSLFKYPNSVVLFDEAGGFLNSRFWKDVEKEFLFSLFQLRHDNIYLIAGYQFLSQVDKQFREVCQNFVVCSSMTERKSKKSIAMRLPNLLIRYAHYYDAEMLGKIEFEKPNAIRRWMMAIKVEYSFYFLKAGLFKLFFLFCYLLTEIFNVFIWYHARVKGIRYKPILYKELKTDEDLLFACFSSAARLDKFVPRTIHKWVEWDEQLANQLRSSQGIPFTHF